MCKFVLLYTRKTITPSVLEGREEHFLESRGVGGQMKHIFEIPLGTGEGKVKKNIQGIPESCFLKTEMIPCLQSILQKTRRHLTLLVLYSETSAQKPSLMWLSLLLL